MNTKQVSPAVEDQVASPKATEMIQRIYDYLCGTHAAQCVWERLLTPSEQAYFGGSIDAAWPKYNALAMWQQTRGGTELDAIVNLAVELDYVQPGEASWLRRELGLTANDRGALLLPKFSAEQGRLEFGEHSAQFRIYTQPSQPVVILSAFQRALWSKRIENPLTLGQQQSHKAIQHLNKRAKFMRFHVQESATALTWEVSSEFTV